MLPVTLSNFTDRFERVASLEAPGAPAPLAERIVVDMWLGRLTDARGPASVGCDGAAVVSRAKRGLTSAPADPPGVTAIRALLGLGDDAPPGALARWRRGKPVFEPRTLASPYVSISHSGDWFAAVISTGVDVGVDLERVRPIPHARSIAARWFSEPEARLLSGVRAAERDRRFFMFWTAREALFKGIGFGLPTRRLVERLTCRHTPSFAAVLHRRRTRIGDWTILHVALPSALLACIAVRHPVVEVRARPWCALRGAHAS